MVYLWELHIRSEDSLLLIKSVFGVRIQLESSLCLQFLISLRLLNFSLVSPFIRILHVAMRFEVAPHHSLLLVGVDISGLGLHLPVRLPISLRILFWIVLLLVLVC